MMEGLLVTRQVLLYDLSSSLPMFCSPMSPERLASYASDMSLNLASACALLSGFLSCMSQAETLCDQHHHRWNWMAPIDVLCTPPTACCHVANALC